MTATTGPRDTASPMRVLVPDQLGRETLNASTSLAAATYTPGQPWPSEFRDATVVVVGFDDAAAIGAQFGALSHLALVHTLYAGFEPWLSVLPDGVMLTNGRGAHGGSCAEWVVAVLLRHYRLLEQFTRQQEAGIWAPIDGDTLIGKRVLVLGAGDLARNLAARLTPFETEVTLLGRHARPGVAAISDLPDLLPHSDVVVAMLPDDPATHHLVDAEFLARLRDGALVVNVGRGAAVDTEALVVELTSGRLHAALDVTEEEPLPDGHPLWSTPNLLITPHIAARTAGNWRRAWAIARAQIEQYAAGATPSNLVAGPASGAPQA